MSCPFSRKYPLRQPEGHEPPVPRWKLQLPPGVDHVYTTYVGVQTHDTKQDSIEAATKAAEALVSWLSDDVNGPLMFEPFSVVDGDKKDSKVWVAYWIDGEPWKLAISQLNLPQIHDSLGTAKSSIGIWNESFETAISRLETNYSGLDYLPGLGKIPNSEQERHKFSAYWGAARDRIPGSGIDAFERVSETEWELPTSTPVGLGERLVGTNYDNMVHIRSGQYWENTGPEERAAYEGTLEPTLMKGLGYLWENSPETGCIGLRFLRNLDANGHGKLETCGAGFFRSLEDLEAWAKSHPTHKAIYSGLMNHAKKFGPTRKLRTWHEVSVLKKGEARFDYVNCLPETGAIRFVKLRKMTL